MRRIQSAHLGAIALIVVIVIVMIGGIVWVGRLVTGSNKSLDNKPDQEKIDFSDQLLKKPKDNTSVKMLVRGPITSKEKHYSIDLEISQSKRELKIFRGYANKKLIKQVKLDNDQAAFHDLLLALKQASFNKENKEAPKKNNGICASGQLISFVLNDGSKVVKDLYTTTCPKIVTSFAGDADATIKLLLNQIDGSNKLIQQAISL